MTRLATDGLRYLRRMGRRGAKWARLKLEDFGDKPKSSEVAFIFGCHRSGTKMLLRTIERSRVTWTYPEHNRRAFDGDYRLRPLSRVTELIESSPAEIVVFKPICDSHRADLLLDQFEAWDACGLWIYRGFRDVVNSLVGKWGRHFMTVMRKIGDGRRDEVGWRGERLSDELVSEIAPLCGENLSEQDAAAIFWYVRNRFYLDLGLHRDPRIRLVSYERVVEQPLEYLPTVFRFLGLAFDPYFAGHIHGDAVGRRPPPALDRTVEVACDDLHSRLEALHP